MAYVRARKLLGVARDVHSLDALESQLSRYLCGDYGGGGVLAVAMHGASMAASTGMEGGVKLFRIVAGTGELERVGDVPGLARPLPGSPPVLVTCLQFDPSGRLYLGGRDGILRSVTFSGEEGKAQAVRASSLEHVFRRPPSPILLLDVSEELDVVATAHANGSVCVSSVGQGHDREQSLLRV